MKNSVHPAAADAYAWITELNDHAGTDVLLSVLEGVVATGSNDLIQRCSFTLGRLVRGEDVTDTEILGLAWVIRDLWDQQNPIYPPRE